MLLNWTECESHWYSIAVLKRIPSFDSWKKPTRPQNHYKVQRVFSIPERRKVNLKEKEKNFSHVMLRTPLTQFTVSWIVWARLMVAYSFTAAARLNCSTYFTRIVIPQLAPVLLFYICGEFHKKLNKHFLSPFF